MYCQKVFLLDSQKSQRWKGPKLHETAITQQSTTSISVPVFKNMGFAVAVLACPSIATTKLYMDLQRILC